MNDIHPHIDDLERICLETEKLGKSTAWESERDKIRSFDEEWIRLDPDNSQADMRQRFNSAKERFEGLYSHHMEIKSHVDQAVLLCEQLESFVGKIGQETIAQVKDIVQTWSEFNDIPEQYRELLQKRFDQAKIDFERERKRLEDLKQLRESRIPKLEQCCMEIEGLLSVVNPFESEAVYKDLIQKWKLLTDEIENIEEYKERFHKAEATFAEKKLDYEKNKVENIRLAKEKLEDLIQKMGKFSETEDCRSILPQVRELQDSWSKIGNDFGDIDVKRLRSSLKKMFNLFFGRLKSRRDEEDWARWENYTRKLQLCEAAEALEKEKDNFKVSKTLKDLRRQWKTLGPAPREKSDEVWKRFNSTCDLLYERCRGFFNELQNERSENLKIKQDLLIQVERLKNSRKWLETTDQIKEIQKTWKETGSVPREQERELYENFKNACNLFFENRKEHYKDLRDFQAANRKDKLEICDKAGALMELPIKDGFKLLDDIERQWKNIGPARRRDEQKLWQRLNDTIDAFYARIDKERPENLAKKEELCEKAEALVLTLKDSPDFESLESEIKKLRTQWEEIGPIPKDNEEEVSKRFNKPLDELERQEQERLKMIMNEKRQNLTNKNKLLSQIEALALQKMESEELQGEIDKIKTDWNSIGQVPEEYADIDERLTVSCEALTEGKLEFFKSMKSQRKGNLSKKVELCVRIEKIAGISAPDDALNSPGNALSLAEELKFSIMDNFASTTNMNSQKARQEFKSIQKDWNKTGPVPSSEEERIAKRFQRAVDAFIEKNPAPSGKRRR